MAVVETAFQSNIRENNHNEPIINMDYLVPPPYRPTSQELLYFEPKQEWLAVPCEEMGKDHSPDHAARVLTGVSLFCGYYAARGMPIEPKKVRGLKWYAAIHDSQRMDDGYDKLHGLRAAQKAPELLGGRVGAEELSYMQRFCRIHVPDDTKLPFPLTLEDCIAKDADLLDRNRGACDLKRRYVRLPITHAFIHHFRQLHEASLQVPESYGSPFQRVVVAGQELGLVM